MGAPTGTPASGAAEVAASSAAAVARSSRSTSSTASCARRCCGAHSVGVRTGVARRAVGHRGVIGGVVCSVLERRAGSGPASASSTPAAIADMRAMAARAAAWSAASSASTTSRASSRTSCCASLRRRREPLEAAAACSRAPAPSIMSAWSCATAARNATAASPCQPSAAPASPFRRVAAVRSESAPDPTALAVRASDPGSPSGQGSPARVAPPVPAGATLTRNRPLRRRPRCRRRRRWAGAARHGRLVGGAVGHGGGARRHASAAISSSSRVAEPAQRDAIWSSAAEVAGGSETVPVTPVAARARVVKVGATPSIPLPRSQYRRGVPGSRPYQASPRL